MEVNIDFNKIKDQVSSLAHSGVAKSKELAEIAKLRMNNSSEEDSIRKTYGEIGKKYYELHGAQPEDAYKDMCEKITASINKIEENKKKIEEIRTANDISQEEMDSAAAATQNKTSEAEEAAQEAEQNVEQAAQDIGEKN